MSDTEEVQDQTVCEAGRFYTNGRAYSWSSDSMEVLHYNDVFAFQIEEPWAGSTETGFGQSCDLSLSAEQARKLAHWILETLGS